MLSTTKALQKGAQPVAVQAKEEEFLTVNMVMPAVGDTGKGDTSLGRLFLALAGLALERFGAAPENERKDAAPEPQGERGGSLSLFPNEGERVPKAGEGLAGGFKVQVGSGSSLQESMPSCRSGVRVDPFDGQLLSVRMSECGYQLCNIGSDLKDDSGGKGDRLLAVPSTAQGFERNEL